MTFAFWCLTLSVFLPLVWIGIAKVGSGNYDNARPRNWREQLQGKYQRAAWAETNSYDVFPPFAAGIILAHYLGASQPVVDTLAGVFIVARILHGVFYITDRDLPRSLVWLLSYFSMVGLYLVAGWTS